MATLIVNSYLDELTRVAGESFTLNGAILTIRTDTRTPTLMTGSIGSVTISPTLGGSYEIDATKVRWLEITGGSGTYPIGTIITQGGVAGYFLGYWASLTSAPSTTVGATGFIKLREVTGGSFTAGALSGITATAVGADKVGWIEVVHDQVATLTIPRLGKFKTRGDWFELGVTSGVANQVIQFPTMGSSTSYATGVWIETGVGTNQYEFYPSIAQALMIVANLGTDIRSKFVGMNTTGGVTLGGNGSVVVGYLPPAGCRVRIPNIIGRQCATTTRATNAIPHATVTSRPEFLTTSAGVLDVEMFNTDWYFNLSQPVSVRLHNVSKFDTLSIAECATALDIYECHNNISAGLDVVAMALTSNFAGGTIENCRMERYLAGANDHSISMSYCKGQTFKNVTTGIIQYARSSGYFYVTQCYDITVDSCSVLNSYLSIVTCFRCSIKNHNHVDRYMGTTNTTTGVNAINVSASSDTVLIDGVSFGYNNTITNTHPYLGVVTVGQSSNITVRNIGSRVSFLNGGATNQPAYILTDAGNNNTVRVQRCYMAPTRTGAISTTNSSKNMLFEHVYGDMADAHVQACLNATVRNCGATPTTTGQASVYGTHVSDYFTSDTTGALLFHFNEPTTESSPYVQTQLGATSGFTSAGNVSLAEVGDYVQYETPYFIKGHTGFQNVAATYTGTNTTTNHTYTYQIDTGSGYGAEKVFNPTNLSAEVIDPSVGFRLKLKVTCSVANTGNLVTYIRVNTTSTLEAQTNNLYPLDTITLTLTGLVAGSDIVILNAGTTVERVNVDANNSTSYNFIYETLGNVDIKVYKKGFIPFSIMNYPLGSTNASLPVAQVADRNFIE